MTNKNKPVIVATDLDGTLLNSDSKISDKDLGTFRKLKEKGVTIVLATGRSLYSAGRVLPEYLEVDYLVSSSGAGIFDWRSKQLIRSYGITINDSERVFKLLHQLKLDFTIQHKVPNNHQFFFIRQSHHNHDFERRNSLYPGHFSELQVNEFKPMECCQFLAITHDPKGPEIYSHVKKQLSGLKVIRSTSPIDGNTTWIEVYHPNVSKANGIRLIAEMKNVRDEDIYAIGNDFNDLDMLRWCRNSLVVSNAPEELKNEFKQVASNNENAFSEAVEIWLPNLFT